MWAENVAGSLENSAASRWGGVLILSWEVVGQHGRGRSGWHDRVDAFVVATGLDRCGLVAVVENVCQSEERGD